MNHKLLLAVSIGCSVQASQAQAQPPLIKQGNYQFELKNYYEAAQYYEKYLSTEKHRVPQMAIYAIEKISKGITGRPNFNKGIVLNLAESYRQVHDYKNAEKWYKEACKQSKNTSASTRYWYAVCLRANEKYAEATGLLTKIIAEPNLPGELRIDVARELNNLKFIEAEMNKPLKGFQVERLRDGLHTSSYALALKSENSMVFTGIAQQNVVTKKGKNSTAFINGLYTTEPGFDFVNGGRQVINGKNDGMNEGMASFSADGRRMYFTRWYKKEAKTNSSVYVSVKDENGEWGSPVMLDEKVNKPDYNSAQPFITDDGKYLLYTSDRPGGSGKYDIWKASLDSSGNTLSVENMGFEINTAEDEFSPYYHSKSGSLVFSSNGRIGMGGFDLYSSHGNIDSSTWEQPVNPGAPLNSSKDDLFFTSTDKVSCWNAGYISSDRGAGECCLAVYTIQQNNGLQVNGVVSDGNTNQPLQGVIVRAIDSRNGNRELQSVVTDEQGKYRFAVRNISEFDVVAEKDAYSQQSNHIIHQLKTGEDTLQIDALALTSLNTKAGLKTNTSLDTNAVDSTENIADESKNTNTNATYVGNFGFGKSSLNAISNTNLDSLAEMMNTYPTVKVQLSGYTDGKGSDEYNVKLAQKRVDACIKYLVKKGIDKSRLKGEALGKCCPLQAETSANGKDIPAARKYNRRVEYVLLSE
ncbi:MAG: OmpA family protein [Chitinophagaceae bacterium]